MSPRKSGRSAQIRESIAQAAARLMLEAGIRDYQVAKRKAAERLRVAEARHLPGNDEIEQAIQEYQRIFRSDQQPAVLNALRRGAVQAMRLLSRFEACLVGPVLSGSADQHSAVDLHLFSEPSEEVGLFLMERHIPHELGERRLRASLDDTQYFPVYRFVAEDIPIELTVLPLRGRRQAPLSPVDGKPMRRAVLAEVEALLAEAG